MKLDRIWTLIRNALSQYRKNDPIRLSGTTAFFMVIAMAPIIVIITTIAGMLISESAIQDKILLEAQNIIGKQGKEYIQMLIDSYSKVEKKSVWGTIILVVVFLGISTTFFSVVQNTINYIWRVRTKPKHSLLKILQDRVLSFGMILTIGLILLVTLFLDAGVGILNDYLSNSFPHITLVLIRILNILISFGVATLVFAMIYRFLPDAKIKWEVTWVGALITALLFTAGKFLIGLLLGNSGIADLYGAAGSIIVVLLWLFYSSIIFYFGAEITRQYATMYAKDIIPQKHAVEIEITEISKES